MSYQSVDKLQKALAEGVFHYAKDSKKAAGRALGTLVEIITFYLLKTWKLTDCIAIERGLQEYGNPDISHNVEYSLHPELNKRTVLLPNDGKSITAGGILKMLEDAGFDVRNFEKKSVQLVNKESVLRNACTVAVSPQTALVCTIAATRADDLEIHVIAQHRKPYAIFECKRVGVEEGMTKGPQTIEKAKQGAYVARTASSLQKIRTESGDMFGIVYKSDGTYLLKPYSELLDEVVNSTDTDLLRRFILTVGVVSNHGNWFTSDNQNKEMKVLAQSYDWLLFLTDAGLAEFIETLILTPIPNYQAVQVAFMASYTGEKTKTQFTKVQMRLEADAALQAYFTDNLKTIEGWFNVIAPKNKNLKTLQAELNTLRTKNWNTILP